MSTSHHERRPPKRRVYQWRRRTEKATVYGAWLEGKVGDLLKEFEGRESVPIDRLRALYDEREQAGWLPGAEIVDEEFNAKYRVAIAEQGSSVEIASVEIVPRDSSVPIKPEAYRLPIKTLVRETLGHLALVDVERDLGRVVIHGKARTVPTPELLSALVSRGAKRQDIAEQLGYSVPRIQQFIAQYRETHSDLEWGVPRGPRPGAGSIRKG